MELSKQKNYQQSFDLACGAIKGMDLEERAKKAGADYRKEEEGEKIIRPPRCCRPWRPRVNFPRPTVSDGTDTVRPATLRGLGPDQVLVLINGKRRHTTAVLISLCERRLAEYL